MTYIPFQEPPFINGLPSPYYKESHRKWQHTCREFISKTLLQDAFEWDERGEIPEDVFGKFAQANFLIPNLPSPLPLAWLKRLGVYTLPGGLPVEEYDYFHFLIYTDEVGRHNSFCDPET